MDNIYSNAVKSGNFELIQRLKQKGISIHSCKKDGYWPFFLLADRIDFNEKYENGFQILENFLSMGLDFNIKYPKNGYTLLHFAAEKGNLQLINFILKRTFKQLDLGSKEGLTPLHLAAMKGHLNVVSFLIKKNQKEQLYCLSDNEGRTPLLLAAMKGDIKIVDILLQPTIKANDNIKKEIGNKKKNKKFSIAKFLFFYSACMIGKIETVKSMLRRNEVNINDYLEETGKTPFHIAVAAKHEEIVTILLQNKADVNAREKRVINIDIDPIFCSVGGNSPLHIAVQTQNESLVKLLLNHGAHLVSYNVYSQTPFFLASRAGTLEIVKLLLNPKCFTVYFQLFFKEKLEGWTPVHAASGNHLEIVKYLVNIFEENKNWIAWGIQEISAMLLAENVEKEIDITRFSLVHIYYQLCETWKLFENYSDMKSRKQLTPLMIAASTGNAEIVRYLLEKEASPRNVGGTHKQMPIYFAASSGSLEVIQILYEISSTKKAEKLRNNYFCLYNACYYGRREVVSFLLEKQVDPNLCLDESYLPSLHAAAQQGYYEIVEILLEAGAKCDTKTHIPFELWEKPEDEEEKDEMKEEPKEYFSSPLLIAAHKGHDKVVELLLKHEANPNKRLHMPLVLRTEFSNYFKVGGYRKFELFNENIFKYSYTPLHLAVEFGKNSVIEKLIEYGADFNSLTLQSATPISLAIEQDNQKIIETLLNAGVNLIYPCSKLLPPVSHAVKFSKVYLLKLFLSKGAPLDLKIPFLEPLLQIAIFASASLEMVHFLISRCGVDINGKTNSGLPYLHYFVEQKLINDDVNKELIFDEKEEIGSCEILKHLLEYGADPNVYSEKCKKNIFHYAIFEGQVIAVNLLIKHGANLNSLDSKGNALFMLILKRQNALLDYSGEDDEPFAKRFLSKPTARNDPIATKWIIVSMTREFARLEAANKEISEQNRKCLRKRSVLHFYNKCKKEIEQMKNMMIKKNLSYLDFLIADEEMLESYTKEIKSIIKFLNTCNKFPIYKRILRDKFDEGMERKNLIEKNLEFFMKISLFQKGCKILDKMTNKVCSSLKLVDLRNLFAAWKVDCLTILEDKENGYFSDEVILEFENPEIYDPENDEGEDFQGDDAIFDEYE